MKRICMGEGYWKNENKLKNAFNLFYKNWYSYFNKYYHHTLQHKML